MEGGDAARCRGGEQVASGDVDGGVGGMERNCRAVGEAGRGDEEGGVERDACAGANAFLGTSGGSAAREWSVSGDRNDGAADGAESGWRACYLYSAACASSGS